MNTILRRPSLSIAPIIAAVLLHLPSVASACAVCTAGRDEENAFAFLMTTIFMSIMPLAAIGTLVWVLWRRIQKLEAQREEAAATGATVRNEAR